MRILMFVPWPVHRTSRFDPAIRNPDQVVTGERYWFARFWPEEASIDVIGIRPDSWLSPIEKRSRFYFQFARDFRRIGEYDALITHDSQSAFLFALLRSKFDFEERIPHLMIDVGLPGSPERLWPGLPASTKYFLLRQTFNPKSVSRIVFHSLCQRPFYTESLRFPDDRLSYVPFGVETDYFAPVSVPSEDYVYAAGEFRDYETLLAAYDRWGDSLPELRIRSELPPPRPPPPRVRWLPRASVAVFRDDVARARFVVLPLHRTNRSTGLMTLLQCMSMGKAVLVSKVPPVDGYVRDGDDAVYYTPYDAADLSAKIRTLFSDPGLVRTIGRHAHESVQSRFTVRAMAEGIWDAVIDTIPLAAARERRRAGRDRSPGTP